MMEEDTSDDVIAAHVYAGNNAIQTALITPTDQGYVITDGDGGALDMAPTQADAARLADMYLEGYLRGYRDFQEVCRDTRTISRDSHTGVFDHRDAATPACDGRNRDDGEGGPEGNGQG